MKYYFYILLFILFISCKHDDFEVDTTDTNSVELKGKITKYFEDSFVPISNAKVFLYAKPNAEPFATIHSDNLGNYERSMEYGTYIHHIELDYDSNLFTCDNKIYYVNNNMMTDLNVNFIVLYNEFNFINNTQDSVSLNDYLYLDWEDISPYGYEIYHVDNKEEKLFRVLDNKANISLKPFGKGLHQFSVYALNGKGERFSNIDKNIVIY